MGNPKPKYWKNVVANMQAEIDRLTELERLTNLKLKSVMEHRDTLVKQLRESQADAIQNWESLKYSKQVVPCIIRMTDRERGGYVNVEGTWHRYTPIDLDREKNTLDLLVTIHNIGQGIRKS